MTFHIHINSTILLHCPIICPNGNTTSTAITTITGKNENNISKIHLFVHLLCALALLFCLFTN